MSPCKQPFQIFISTWEPLTMHVNHKSIPTFIHHSIHHLYHLSCRRHIYSNHQARRGVHHGQVGSPLQGNTEAHAVQTTMHTHTHIQRQFKKANWPNSNVFGLWGEAGVPGGNSHMHRKNMLTLCRKIPEQDLKPRTFLLQGNSANSCATLQPHNKSYTRIQTLIRKSNRKKRCN